MTRLAEGKRYRGLAMASIAREAAICGNIRDGVDILETALVAMTEVRDEPENDLAMALHDLGVELKHWS